MALVRAACPHDCPDTCAMHVTVEDGGRPRSPATRTTRSPPASSAARCRTTSTASTPRIVLHAADPHRRRRARASSARRPGTRRSTGSPRARARRPPRPRVDPALQLHGHPGPDPGQRDERARVQRARRHRARAHDLRHRGHAGTERHPRPLARGRSRGVAARAPRARLGLEPDVDRAAPLAQAARRAQERRRRSSSIDPFRSRTARVADEHVRPLPGTDGALALGMMRAVVDAGLQDEEWCRAHADGYDELLERARRLPGRALRRDLRRAGGRRSRASASSSRSDPPALLRLGVGAQRHMGAPDRLPHDRLPARADRRVARPRRRLLATSRRRRRPRSARTRSSARTCGPARRARSTCRSSATR